MQRALSVSLKTLKMTFFADKKRMIGALLQALTGNVVPCTLSSLRANRFGNTTRMRVVRQKRFKPPRSGGEGQGNSVPLRGLGQSPNRFPLFIAMHRDRRVKNVHEGDIVTGVKLSGFAGLQTVIAGRRRIACWRRDEDGKSQSAASKTAYAAA